MPMIREPAGRNSPRFSHPPYPGAAADVIKVPMACSVLSCVVNRDGARNGHEPPETGGRVGSKPGGHVCKPIHRASADRRTAA